MHMYEVRSSIDRWGVFLVYLWDFLELSARNVVGLCLAIQNTEDLSFVLQSHFYSTVWTQCSE